LVGTVCEKLLCCYFFFFPLRFLKLWVAPSAPPPPPTGRERPVAIDTSGWVGPTSGLDVLEKNRLPLPGIQPLIVQPSHYTTKIKCHEINFPF